MSDTLPNMAEEVPPHLAPKKLTEFLESLQRIFKIGTYYPAGHAVLDQAVHVFQNNLQKISETKRTVSIALKKDAVLVEEVELAQVTNAVRELQRLLQDLGIGRIEIDRTINLNELIQFVRALLLGRAQLQGIKQFTQAKIVDVPQAVRIVQKEFLVDEASILVDTRTDDDGQSLDAIFQMLADQGLDRVQIAQCRDFLNSLAKRFSSRPLNVKGLPSVSWSDVRRLLVKVVTNAHLLTDDTGKVFGYNDLNALSAIFNGLQHELGDQESQETINLLVSVFNHGNLAKKSEVVEGQEKSRGVRADDNAQVMTVSELQAFVRDNRTEVKDFEKIKQVDRHEELVILLQLFQYPQENEVSEGIRRNLRGILTTPLSPRDVDVLIKGVVRLTECEETERFREAVAFLVLLLRSAKNFSSQHFLVMLCRKLPPDFKMLIWSIVINEMLAVGRIADQQGIFADLAAIAADQPQTVIRQQLQGVEDIDTLKERKIAADIFDPAVRSAYPIYAALMDSSMRIPIGARVLSGMLAAPPDRLIEAVSPILQLSQPGHAKFLQSYLTLAQQKIFPVSLRIMAGNIVVEHLPEIEEAARNDAWVAKTIEATGEMQVEGTRGMLEKIISEKKMVVIPKWPAACRRAATEALKSLKRKPLG